MKKISFIALIAFLLTSMTPVFADHGQKRCPMSKHESKCQMGSRKSCKKSECPITSAIMKKSCFFLSNSDAIGLGEEQVKHIKSISMETMKQSILGKAQMKVGRIDLESKLHEEKLDVEGLTKMIDEFSAGMAASMKKTLQSYAELRSILTPEQMAKAKEIWKKDKN